MTIDVARRAKLREILEVLTHAEIDDEIAKIEALYPETDDTRRIRALEALLDGTAGFREIVLMWDREDGYWLAEVRCGEIHGAEVMQLDAEAAPRLSLRGAIDDAIEARMDQNSRIGITNDEEINAVAPPAIRAGKEPELDALLLDELGRFIGPNGEHVPVVIRYDHQDGFWLHRARRDVYNAGTMAEGSDPMPTIREAIEAGIREGGDHRALAAFRALDDARGKKR